jgi:hypothetical protein
MKIAITHSTFKAALFLAFAIFLPIFLPAQTSQGITTMDFVKTHTGKEAEVRYFYENNWLAFRKEALKRKYIAAYELVTVQDSTLDYDIMLLTHYKDSTQFAAIEKRFTEVMKKIQPKGTKFLNALQEKEFRTYVRGFMAKAMYSSYPQSK